MCVFMKSKHALLFNDGRSNKILEALILVVRVEKQEFSNEPWITRVIFRFFLEILIKSSFPVLADKPG